MGDCRRRFNISETVIETFHVVMQSHANPLGILHGGNLIRWLVDAASLTASRVVRGYAVLAGIDFVYLGDPVRVGETLATYSWAGYTGRSSVEVGVSAYAISRDGESFEVRKVSAAHMTLVYVGGGPTSITPRPHMSCVKPSDSEEEVLYESSIRLREMRRGRLSKRKQYSNIKDPPTPLVEGYVIESHRIVNPVDSLAYNVMHAGSLLYLVDEVGGILASKYSKGVVVTGYLGPADFYRPIYTGSILRLVGAISYVGSSTIEVEIRSLTSLFGEGIEGISSRSYVTYINLGWEGKPTPVRRSDSVDRVVMEESIERARERSEIIRSLEGGSLKIDPPPMYLERLAKL
ncbi:MAG: acyl-CoA thioesterase [Aeropyrum sp.]|nr:acyl-CoA thioesterase [Aeropyrum sp.]MCE4616501.1 acyl-CoA thioesterase [Aeropyrum sp.]